MFGVRSGSRNHYLSSLLGQAERTFRSWREDHGFLVLGRLRSHIRPPGSPAGRGKTPPRNPELAPGCRQLVPPADGFLTHPRPSWAVPPEPKKAISVPNLKKSVAQIPARKARRCHSALVARAFRRSELVAHRCRTLCCNPGGHDGRP
jgi:hypothetical protein